jgi:uncharacterized protein
MTTVASPCISLCQMDAASGLCKGCWRTIDDIVAWGRLSDAGKLLILKQIALRKTQVVFDKRQLGHN